MRILILNSEPFSSSLLKTFLEHHDFVVDLITEHHKGFYRATSGLYDTIIYDQNFEEYFPEKLMEALPKIEVPLIVHIESNIDLNIKLRKIGIQHIFYKPVSSEETVFVIRNLISQAPSKKESILKFEDLELNILTRTVTRGNKTLFLRSKELILLEYLMLHPREVITRIRLLQHVWPNFTNITTNTVDAHICELRKKLDRDFERKLLVTIHGVGYKIG